MFSSGSEKKLILFLLVFFTGSRVYSFEVLPSCQRPKAVLLEKKDKYYEFVVEQICYLERIRKIDQKSFTISFIKHLKDNPNYQGIRVREGSSYKGKKSTMLTFSQVRDSKYGKIKLKAQMNLICNSDDESYENYYETTKIDAEKEAKHTKHVKETILVTKLSQNYKVSIKRSVKIKRPWYAPKKIFTSKTLEGLEEEIHELSKVHMDFIAG